MKRFPGILLSLLISVLVGGCASSRLSREETILQETSPLVQEADRRAQADLHGPPQKREGYTCPVCQF